MSENNLIRLQKYIADCGIASRRKAEELISNGNVKVNNKIVNQMGIKIDPSKDEIKVNGKVIKILNNKRYILLNKPVGYITTTKDEFDRPTVLDLVEVKERIFPIGRLDYDTSGLILLTSDGELANKLMHPSHEVGKTYVVDVLGTPSFTKIDKLRDGIRIEDYVTSPAEIKILKSKGRSTTLEITIHEGKNRQVRKMFETIGHAVLKLKRISIGNIKLSHLKEGNWRNLKHHEIEYLKNL